MDAQIKPHADDVTPSRPALVQGRDHLSAARQVVLRQQQRRHRRFPRPDLASSITSPISASTRSGCCRSIPRRGATTATTSRLSRRSSRLRHACATVKRFIREAHRARHPRHHRTGRQPHLRPASLVPARAPRQARLAVRATSMSGRTPTRNMPARASSSSIPSSRTGPGIRSPARITGTASTRISRI